MDFQGLNELEGRDAVQGAVLRSMARWTHMYAWLTYPQIRRTIPDGVLSPSAASKQRILAALRDLETTGYVQSKGKLWGVTPQYDAFLRALKATQTGAR